ncbi:MAG: DUF4268 domain-containing protein [Akkermansia sp.]
MPQQYEANKACTVSLIRKIDVRNRGTWPDIFKWLRSRAILLRKVFKPRVA